jgi:hypothetical protein
MQLSIFLYIMPINEVLSQGFSKKIYNDAIVKNLHLYVSIFLSTGEKEVII